MRRVLVAVGGIGVALLICAVALGGGGKDIASAPELPIGQNKVGGGDCTGGGACINWGNSYAEFWRITLRASDQLTINFGSTNGDSVRLCLLSPTVTDYTLENAKCSDEGYTEKKSQFRYGVPNAGRWTLAMFTFRGHALAYELTAYVRHYTSTRLSLPRLVRVGHAFKVTGAVGGASGGKIELRITLQGSKVRSVPVTLSRSGAFNKSVAVSASGRYRVQAFYYGDDGHLPSRSRVVLINAV